MKNTVELDGLKISSMLDFHEEIKKKMNFPDFYGKNLDALWDCLIGHADTNIYLVWKDHRKSEEKLGNQYSRIIEIFRDLKLECPEFEFRLD